MFLKKLSLIFKITFLRVSFPVAKNNVTVTIDITEAKQTKINRHHPSTIYQYTNKGIIAPTTEVTTESNITFKTNSHIEY